MDPVIAQVAEWTAVGLNIAFAYLIGRSLRSGWLCGFVAAVITVWLYAAQDAWLMAALNVFYAVMGVYGWWNWGRPTEEEVIRTLRWPTHLVFTTLILAGTWSLLRTMQHLDVPGEHQWMEAFIASGAMVATWMMGRKVLENWAYWIVGDAVGVVYNHLIGYDGYAFLNVVYIVLGVIGFIRWRRKLLLAQLQTN